MERSTRQRTAIRAAIDSAQRPLSPQEVLAASQADVAGLGLPVLGEVPSRRTVWQRMRGYRLP